MPCAAEPYGSLDTGRPALGTNTGLAGRVETEQDLDSQADWELCEPLEKRGL